MLCDRLTGPSGRHIQDRVALGKPSSGGQDLCCVPAYSLSRCLSNLQHLRPHHSWPGCTSCATFKAPPPHLTSSPTCVSFLSAEQWLHNTWLPSHRIFSFPHSALKRKASSAELGLSHMVPSHFLLLHEGNLLVARQVLAMSQEALPELCAEATNTTAWLAPAASATTGQWVVLKKTSVGFLLFPSPPFLKKNQKQGWHCSVAGEATAWEACMPHCRAWFKSSLLCFKSSFLLMHLRGSKRWTKCLRSRWHCLAQTQVGII